MASKTAAASVQKYRPNERSWGGAWRIRSGVERMSEIEFITVSSNLLKKEFVRNR